MTGTEKSELVSRLSLIVQRLENLEEFALRVNAIDIHVRLTTSKNAAAAALEVARKST